MHQFFQPAHTKLHQHVLDILTASRSIHSILPLFHLNCHFRHLVTERLMKPFQNVTGITRESNGRVTVAKEGAGYIKLAEGQPIIVPGDQAPVLEPNDTRYLFSQEHYADDDDEFEVNEAVFVLKKYDAETTICTFGSPSGHKTVLTFEIPVKPSGEVDFDTEFPSRAVWQIGSSMWFIKSKPIRDRSAGGEVSKSFAGLELGFKQHRHASREIAFVTKVSDKRCGKVSSSNFELREGWYGSVETTRMKRRNRKDEYDQLHAAVQLNVKEIKVPLLLLYIGPTSLDDFNSLDDSECDYYRVKNVERFEKSFIDGSWGCC